MSVDSAMRLGRNGTFDGLFLAGAKNAPTLPRSFAGLE
jgi:hypothetical protein